MLLRLTAGVVVETGYRGCITVTSAARVGASVCLESDRHTFNRLQLNCMGCKASRI